MKLVNSDNKDSNTPTKNSATTPTKSPSKSPNKVLYFL